MCNFTEVTESAELVSLSVGARTPASTMRFRLA